MTQRMTWIAMATRQFLYFLSNKAIRQKNCVQVHTQTENTFVKVSSWLGKTIVLHKVSHAPPGIWKALSFRKHDTL